MCRGYWCASWVIFSSRSSVSFITHRGYWCASAQHEGMRLCELPRIMSWDSAVKGAPFDAVRL